MPLGAVLILAGATISALAQAQPSQPVSAGKTTAAKTVPGHVPDQQEQAQKAPVSTAAADSYASSDLWWSPGQGGTLAATQQFENAHGRLGLINTGGAIDTKGHPFFEPIGKNGRACVSCHQPADAMSLLAGDGATTLGGDRRQGSAIRGGRRQQLPALCLSERPSSHSLLLERGLIRVFLPWPPKSPDRQAIGAGVHDRSRRRSDGMQHASEVWTCKHTPMVSVYRRPRVMANMKYVISGGGLFNIKDGSLMSKDPDTGRPVSMQLMADARQPTLKTQAIEAAIDAFAVRRQAERPAVARDQRLSESDLPGADLRSARG